MRAPLRPAAALAALLAACNPAQPCPVPLVECGGQCLDVASDRYHCGGCGAACDAGQVCSSGRCTADVRAPCAIRTGGAFVTFGACGSAVKTWIRTPAFVDEAATYVGTTGVPRTPLLALERKVDCDAQWSWTVDDLDASWVASATVPCTSACPAALEAQVRNGTLPVGQVWCPTPSPALVLGVDRRPPP